MNKRMSSLARGVFLCAGVLFLLPGGVATAAQENYARDLSLERVTRHRSRSVGIEKSPLVLLQYVELYTQLGDFSAAESFLKDLLVLSERTLGPDDPEIATRLMSLGWLCAEQDKSIEAESHYVRALNILENAYGRNRPEIAPALNSLAAYYRNQARYSESAHLYHRLLSLSVYQLGAEAPFTAFVMRDLGELYRRESKYDMAAPYYEYVLAILENTYGKNHVEVLFTDTAYASMQRERDRRVPSSVAVSTMNLPRETSRDAR